MALKQLVLRKKIGELKAQLEVLRCKDSEFETRSAEMKKREAELESAVNEVTDETTAEDKATLDAAVEQFDADQKTFESEKEANDGEKTKVESEISGLEKELADLEERSKQPPAVPAVQNRQKEGINLMTGRAKFFRDMTIEQRSALVQRAEVKEFLDRARELKGQNRAVSGKELLIPDILLDLLRDNLYRYSKLYSIVNVRSIGGKARQTIAGTIPEGVWTEMCAKLNELEIDFNQIEVDGYKVGGFIPICNAVLEDSYLNLADEIMDAIGQAIGLALDKAILYGTGVKMPLGIVTRLAQTAEPDDWSANAPAWTDLHVTNILKINPSGMTSEAFFSALLLNLGTARPNYTTGGTFWCMNRKTRMTILSKAITFNAAGAIVAGANGTIPVEGGTIIELPFIPDNDIIGGYGSLYLLAERAGVQLAMSEHVRFIEDETVFKGTARYDGMPVFGESFIALNINNADPTTTITFAPDRANPTTLSSLKIGSLAIAPDFSAATTTYTAATTSATNVITVTPTDSRATVAITVGANAVANGTAATWASGANTVTIKVTNGKASTTYTVTVTKS